jgi:hypothetical protein
VDTSGGIGKMKMIEIAEQEQECVPSWFTFLYFWNVNYPKIVVPNARQDICGNCWMFANTFRKLNRTQLMDDSLEEEFPDFVQDEYEEREAAINKAKAHVERADAQREGFNAYSAQAKHDYLTEKPKSECRYTLVVDYAQNLSLPHLGEEQAGETDYYCPLNVYGFGIVDQATGKLITYIYNEGEGGKGGNNVTSLIHKYLSDRGMLDADNPILSLDIVMDNCSGQNKNRMVL